jgi:signal transduction histidine kinase
MRFGVASRLNAGLLTLTLLIVLGGASSVLFIHSFRNGLDRMAGDYIPTLIAISLVAQQSYSIVSNASALVVADSHFVRQSIADRIEDQAAALEDLLGRLRQDDTTAARDLAGIERLRAELADNFRKLNGAVALRIEQNQRLQQKIQRLIRLPSMLAATARTPSGPGDAAVVEWVVNAQHLVATLLTAAEGRTPRQWAGLRRDVMQIMERQDALTARLPAGAVATARPFMVEMQGLGDGSVGLFSDLAALDEATKGVQRTLNGNRELANQFVAAVSTVTREVEKHALETSRNLTSEVSDNLSVLVLLVAASLAAAVTIVAYVNRNVTRRLLQVHDCMNDRILSRSSAIPVDGDDEIGDIGRALGFFVEAISRREADLRAAKDAAEAALNDLNLAQDRLIQAEKMAALGQLVAGVAHEINTPLGNALTAVSFLADETARIAQVARTGTMRRSDFLQFVDQAIETSSFTLLSIGRAADLVHSFKQVAVDQVSEERRHFDLKVYLDEVLQSLKPTWKKGGHQLEVNCPDGVEIDGPPGALAQVLSNLVMNSLVHAFDEGQSGSLTVQVAMADERMVELLYTDNGKGIPLEFRDKVFDPFFTTKRGAGSTGLGLHIVFNLVTRKLGGFISLDESTSSGCRFRIRFPRVAPADTGGLPAPPVSAMVTS